LMDMAEESAEGDSARLSRVLRARMSVDFAWLDYALNAGDTALSFISFTPEGKKVNANMMAALEMFADNSEKTGIRSISEHGYSVREYRDHVKRLVDMALRNNKARPE